MTHELLSVVKMSWRPAWRFRVPSRTLVGASGLGSESSDFPQSVNALEKPAKLPDNLSARRDGRAADCTGLENRQHESVRGFESLSLRSGFPAKNPRFQRVFRISGLQGSVV